MRGLLLVEVGYNQTIKGLKTQTRRSGGLDQVNHKPDYWQLLLEVNGEAGFRFNQAKQRNPDHVMDVICKANYKVGEVLYLKEPTFKAPWGTVCYRFSEYETFDFVRNPNLPLETAKKVWSNKLFMPAAEARAFVRITGIKLERLFDISDQDCIDEGIEADDTLDDDLTCYKLYGKLTPEANGTIITAVNNKQKSFFSLYKFANKTKEVKNIWVWCYSYEYLPDYKLQS